MNSMTVEQIRRGHINHWADKLGRSLLAKKMGYPDTTYINQLCGGHANCGKRTARKFEKVLGLRVGDFDTETDYSKKETIFKKSMLDPIDRQGDMLPLISFVQAGGWGDVEDPYMPKEAEAWYTSPIEHSENAFLLRNRGVSMSNGQEDGYPDGAILQVEPDLQAHHGSDVIVRTPDGLVTFKRLQETPEGKFLLAINPDYPGRIIKAPEGTIIVGVVTGYWIDRRGKK